MSTRKQLILASIALLLVVSALVGIYVYSAYFNVSTASIDYISSMQKGKNKFQDMAGDINVKSVEDIHYKVNSDWNIVIKYGDQYITMNHAAFRNSKYRAKLSNIGIHVYTHVNADKTVEYKLTYWDDPVEEYSII